ncbi:LPS translocon maturation chaperone LptM [Massilia endophytica]|uniref:LPS translocon maturation chaperone LptM n=1 Tax=Massilia endophytica TaxID=2899220 RepID=UPI0038992D21
MADSMASSVASARSRNSVSVMLHSKIICQTVILIVKSTLALPAIVVLSALLSACGQTGPLYMPKPPAKPATSNELGKPGVAPPSAPVPSTPPASQQ